jgi:hypothetical protein
MNLVILQLKAAHSSQPEQAYGLRYCKIHKVIVLATPAVTARKPIPVPKFCTQLIPENVYDSQNVQKLSDTFICYNGGSVSIV